MAQVWDLWFPSAGSTGLSFARATVDGDTVRGRLLVHAAPPALQVVVRAEDGAVLARGTNLERGAEGPMCWLVVDGDRVRLEDGWPGPDDLGRLVLLPGGEAGILTAWEHADDRSWWRWSVEFANAR